MFHGLQLRPPVANPYRSCELTRVAAPPRAEIVSEFHYRLSPLNQERSYVSFSIIRATFEMGNPATNYSVHDEEDSTCGHKFRIVLTLVLYKAKILLLGFILKQIFKLTMPIEYATWAVGHAGVYSSGFWDVLITKAIMDQVQRRAHGVVASVEIFNEIWDELIETPHKAIAADRDAAAAGKSERQFFEMAEVERMLQSAHSGEMLPKATRSQKHMVLDTQDEPERPTISLRGQEEVARAVAAAIAETVAVCCRTPLSLQQHPALPPAGVSVWMERAGVSEDDRTLAGGRQVAVAIAEQGSMYPPMELLLRCGTPHNMDYTPQRWP